jgi:hypothetical protein
MESASDIVTEYAVADPAASRAKDGHLRIAVDRLGVKDIRKRIDSRRHQLRMEDALIMPIRVHNLLLGEYCFLAISALRRAPPQPGADYSPASSSAIMT